MRHNRVIEFKFLSPTNARPSRVSLIDRWNKQRVEISLSGADMIETVRDYLITKDITIASFGYGVNTDSGVILTTSFDGKIK